jgi:ABC-2 type transport system ATP-binding protein
MSAVLEVNDFIKHYGEFQAVRGISFEVRENEIFGLIGPNGAGKTSTLRVISTLLQITGGQIKVMGHDIATEAHEVRKIISYLPEDAGAYKNLTGREYLYFMARFYGDNDLVEEMVNRGLTITDLGSRIDDKVDQYSKGMMRRLMIGRALMARPKLAILDEPTSGLDVINAKEIRDIIRRTANEGTSVLLSSHNMLEVEFLCDRISLISDGEIVESGNPHDLLQKYDARNIEDVFTEVVR